MDRTMSVDGGSGGTSGKPTREQLQAAYGESIPDLIAPGLRVLFIGINPSLYSAAVGHHFARPGNRFWPALHGAGFTDRLLAPAEERLLLEHGYGITNLVDEATARADELTHEELVRGSKRLAEGPALSPSLGRLSRHLDVSIGGRSTREVSRSAEGQIRRLARVAVTESQRTQPRTTSFRASCGCSASCVCEAIPLPDAKARLMARARIERRRSCRRGCGPAALEPFQPVVSEDGELDARD